jgi:putative transcriptional regulator
MESELSFFENEVIVCLRNPRPNLAARWEGMAVSLKNTVYFSNFYLSSITNKLVISTEVGLKNRLEELRKQQGIKQEDLAAALEVSRQTVGSLENGRYNPSILLAFKIARYFGLQIEDIFIYEEDEQDEKQ